LFSLAAPSRGIALRSFFVPREMRGDLFQSSQRVVGLE
jgi:hypothetical protein